MKGIHLSNEDRVLLLEHVKKTLTKPTLAERAMKRGVFVRTSLPPRAYPWKRRGSRS